MDIETKRYNGAISSRVAWPVGLFGGSSGFGLILTAIVLALALSAPVKAAGIDSLSRKQRIALALLNTFHWHVGVEAAGPEAVTTDKIQKMITAPSLIKQKKLPFLVMRDRGKRRIYALNFRQKEPDRALRPAHYRLTPAIDYQEPQAEEKWRLLKEDEDLGAVVRIRQITLTSAEQYNEVEAVGRIGPLVFKVQLWRPTFEPPARSRSLVLAHLRQLVAYAKEYKLLYHFKVTARIDGKSFELEGGRQLYVLGWEDRPTSVEMKIEVFEDVNKRIDNIDYFAMKPEGELTRFLTIVGATYNKKEERYEVHDQPSPQIELVLPAFEATEFGAVLKLAEKGLRAPALPVELDAALKPAKE